VTTTVEQRYFEDVEPGDEFEESWTPTREDVIAYLKVSNPDREPPPSRFTDDAEAQKIRMPRAIVPGAYSLCMATRVVTNWMGAEGKLHSIDCDFRRGVLHEDTLKILALITDAVEEDGRPLVKLDVYLENERGERPVQGTALVELPRRG
jgi:acyl dehydratase